MIEKLSLYQNMIRVLRDIDYIVVKTLFFLTFHTSEESYFKEAWRHRTIDRSFGLWKEGCLIGLAIVRDTKLEYICIDPTQQGHGWGSLLLRHVLSICPTLYLNPADDPVLCRWYERHGFQLSNEVEHSIFTTRCYVRHRYDTRNKNA
jgi:GNAT superfamily N-acetyltransferase